MAVLSSTTILLLVENAESSVAFVARTLQSQVTITVSNSVSNHLTAVHNLNIQASILLSRRGKASVVDVPWNTSLLPTYYWWLEHCDGVLQAQSVIDNHFMWLPSGRNTGCNRITNTTYGMGDGKANLTFFLYNKGKPWTVNTSDYENVVIVPNYDAPNRAYYKDQSKTVPSQTWYGPISLTTDLTYSNAMNVFDERTGEYIAVLGSGTYTTTFRRFLQSAKPTERTKIALLDAMGYVISTTNDRVAVLTPSGDRIYLNEVQGEEDMAAFGVLVPRGTQTNVSIQTSQYISDESWFVSIESVRAFSVEIIVVVGIPESDFLSGTKRALYDVLAIVITVAIVGTVLVIGVAFVIGVAMKNLSVHLRNASKLDAKKATTENEPPLIFGELRETYRSYNAVSKALTAFKRYVPIGVVRGILEGTVHARLGMGMSELVMTFQDVEKFTAICEKGRSHPNRIVNLVAPVFEKISNLIIENHGTIDKYIGDCIMSFWELGKPGNETKEIICTNAVRTLLVSMGVQAYDERLRLVVKMRSGAHLGPALLGNFGSVERLNYTVLGDAVNIAARLEPLNKEMHSRTLVSASIVDNLKDDHLLCHVRPMGRVLLIGHEEPIRFAEICERAIPPVEKLAWVSMIDFVQQHRFREALDILNNAEDHNDPTIIVMKNNILEAESQPTWDGSWVQHGK
eukprot:PhF_6_TR558/c0_g1_i1/m.529/K01768/E4.6.1.1; adenylate cyclase